MRAENIRPAFAGAAAIVAFAMWPTPSTAQIEPYFSYCRAEHADPRLAIGCYRGMLRAAVQTNDLGYLEVMRELERLAQIDRDASSAGWDRPTEHFRPRRERDGEDMETWRRRTCIKRGAFPSFVSPLDRAEDDCREYVRPSIEGAAPASCLPTAPHTHMTLDAYRRCVARAATSETAAPP